MRVWGAVAFGNVSALQVAMRQAEQFLPDATDVAVGCNISVFNLGPARSCLTTLFVLFALNLSWS